jgi:hypothetical protein
MPDDHLEHLHLRAGFEHRRQVRRHVIDALEAIGQHLLQLGLRRTRRASSLCGLALPLQAGPARSLRWIIRSCQVPATLCRLHLGYGGGDGCVMANWFPMATKGVARECLMGLPPETITSWKDLYERFINKFAPLKAAPEARSSQGLPRPRL